MPSEHRVRSDIVLLTGFEPFGGELVNPSGLVARALDGETIAGARIVAHELPCVFGESRRMLDAWIDTLAPRLVVCVGQAGGRGAISLERVAINVDDARIADNAGKQPVDEPIVPGGPAAYFSTLPIKAIAAALRVEGFEAEVSQSAGTFVCNHVFYGLMHRLAHVRAARGGFVHVPFLPEQAERARTSGRPLPPSLPFVELVRALRVVVKTSLETSKDARISAGSIA